jgi:alpha-glucuronidase
LWEELCLRYSRGVIGVLEMQKTWESIVGYIDQQRAEKVRCLLRQQVSEAGWWRDACIQYFQQFARLPIPQGCDTPAHSLEYYQQLTQHFPPRIAG